MLAETTLAGKTVLLLTFDSQYASIPDAKARWTTKSPAKIAKNRTLLPRNTKVPMSVSSVAESKHAEDSVSPSCCNRREPLAFVAAVAAASAVVDTKLSAKLCGGHMFAHLHRTTAGRVLRVVRRKTRCSGCAVFDIHWVLRIAPWGRRRIRLQIKHTSTVRIRTLEGPIISGAILHLRG